MGVTEIDKSDVCDTTVMRELRKLVSLINTNVVDGLNEELDEIESTLIPETAETVASEVYDSYNVSSLASQVKALASAVNNLQDVQTITAGGSYGKGVYKLDGDIVVDSMIKFTSDAVFMLNGYTVSIESAVSAIESYGSLYLIGEGTVQGRLYHRNAGNLYVSHVTFEQIADSLNAVANYNGVDNQDEVCILDSCTFKWDTAPVDCRYGKWLVQSCVFETVGDYTVSDCCIIHSSNNSIVRGCTFTGPYRRFVSFSGEDQDTASCICDQCTFTSDGETTYGDSYSPVSSLAVNECIVSNCTFDNIASDSSLVYFKISTSYPNSFGIAYNIASSNITANRLLNCGDEGFAIKWEDTDSTLTDTPLKCTYAYDVGDLTCTGTILE